MKSLILCEGKTDAILISYLLCKQWGWSWISSKNKKFKNYQIDVSEINNESAEWYIKDNNELLICGVGGNANFSNFFEDKISSIQVNYNEEDIFKNIICVIDKDNLEIKSKADDNTLVLVACRVENVRLIDNILLA